MGHEIRAALGAPLLLRGVGPQGPAVVLAGACPRVGAVTRLSSSLTTRVDGSAEDVWGLQWARRRFPLPPGECANVPTLACIIVGTLVDVFGGSSLYFLTCFMEEVRCEWFLCSVFLSFTLLQDQNQNVTI